MCSADAVAVYVFRWLSLLQTWLACDQDEDQCVGYVPKLDDRRGQTGNTPCSISQSRVGSLHNVGIRIWE
jgi:hypothetical protein